MIRKCMRFFGTIWGWLVVAAMIGGVSLAIIDVQERYRADLGLRVWAGAAD